ncbi:MAG TPA: glycosyltransferase [Terracidiphilus sp.]|jgi:spore maturation protein CgeB
MKLVFFGLTITSSWGNGHGTTYRSLVKALAARGHRVHFVEKDVEWYRNNRDMPEPAFCSVRLYDDWAKENQQLRLLARDADAIVVGSYFPDAIQATRELLEDGHERILFYDIDTPITMARLHGEGRAEYLDPELIPHYAAYLSFTGGPMLREIENRFGSPWAVPFYCSVDADAYRPRQTRPEFACDMSYLGTYAADRQPKLESFLNDAARRLPERAFLVAGPQYPVEIEWPGNVERIIHLSPREHPEFYSSSRFTLNLTRDDMVAAGYSPSVRLFEASACGAAIISDAWPGLEEFLTPGEEVLLPEDADEVVRVLREMPDAERVRMGQRARQRILDQHTSAHRAEQFENVVAQCATRVQAQTASSSRE